MLQFIRYLLTGAFCAGLEYLSFLALHSGLGWGLIWANTLAFSLGLIASFSINKFLVFTATQVQQTRTQFLAYCLLAGLNYCISTGLLLLLVQQLGMPAWLAKGLTMACVVIWNFVLYKKVIYR